MPSLLGIQLVNPTRLSLGVCARERSSFATYHWGIPGNFPPHAARILQTISITNLWNSLPQAVVTVPAMSGQETTQFQQMGPSCGLPGMKEATRPGLASSARKDPTGPLTVREEALQSRLSQSPLPGSRQGSFSGLSKEADGSSQQAWLTPPMGAL